MRFRRCCIAGQIYSDGPTDASKSALPLEAVERAVGSPEREMDHTARLCEEFVRALSLCHTVVVTPQGQGQGADEGADAGDMQAESPDEEALVKAAGKLGWTFLGRGGGSGKTVVLRRANEETGPTLASFELLAAIPFDSNRKRMSVIVRRIDSAGRGQGDIVLYCKGADNVLLDRCSSFSAQANDGSSSTSSSSGSSSGRDFSAAAGLQAQKDQLLQQLSSFAADGLRTLVIAKRTLSKSEFDQFSASWTSAEAAIVDRETRLAEAADLVERDLCILG